MAALEDFENTLKEVVSGKWLSASKMNRLTEITMKSLSDDTKLVATLYRTHKSLPSAAKVSSLYVFDALARAARSLVNKRGITGDIKSEKGNAATFLLKIEGVLDGLFQDMASLGSSEIKEKTKKVLDIWVKSNTFPSAVLARLVDILSDMPKEAVVIPTPPNAVAEAPTTSPAAPDVQAALLALLGKAAQVNGPHTQTPSNTDAQLQHNQLALLQQLALTAKLAQGASTPPSGQTPPPPPPPPPPPLPTEVNTPPAVIAAPDSSSRPGDPRFESYDTHGDARHAYNGYPDRSRDRHDFRDERHPRGSYRGGHRGRGRWDDHYSRDRFRHRDRDGGSPLRPRRSRSRSPRRREERRTTVPNSPPRDPRHQPRPELPTSSTNAHGKDEFGRDIRAASNSPSRSTPAEDTQPSAPMESSVEPTTGVPPDYHTPVSDPLPLVAASTSAQSTETHTPSSASQQQQPGLDQFDISTFDATAASSWEALGNMWQTTQGYPPSQEELMHFVLTGSMAAVGMANGGFPGARGDQWHQEGWGDRGSWHNSGRGGRGTFGEDSNRDEGEYASESSYVNGDGEPQARETAGKGGGRMQRVGDKWVFVKDA